MLPHEVAADIASEATQVLPHDVAADIAADAAEEGSVPSFLAGAKEEPETEPEPAEEEAPASEESGKTQAGSRKVTVQRGPKVARIHIHVPEGKEAPAAEELDEEAPAQETAVEEAPAEEPVASEEAAPAAKRSRRSLDPHDHDSREKIGRAIVSGKDRKAASPHETHI